MPLKSIFKKPKSKGPADEVEDIVPAEPEKERTKTEVKRDVQNRTPVPKGTVRKKPVTEAPVERAPEPPEEIPAPEKETAKKTLSESSKKKPSMKKETAKKAEPKPVEKKTSEPSGAPSKGGFPSELKGFDKRLKDYAARIRTTFNKGTANSVFTEYMSMVFRDTGHSMVIVRDIEEGIITMLERADRDDNYSVKNKIVVRCVYQKDGSVGPEYVRAAQEDGSFYYSEETWCVTPVDFTKAAVAASHKEEPNVRLIDGKKLYTEYISRFDKRRVMTSPRD